jgi:hypothetical protein
VQVVAVDGAPALEINLIKLIGGCDVVGSLCKLTVRRGGQTREVSIHRTTENRLKAIAQHHVLLAGLVHATQGSPVHEKALELEKHAETLEYDRLKNEESLANKLWCCSTHLATDRPDHLRRSTCLRVANSRVRSFQERAVGGCDADPGGNEVAAS